MLSFGLKIEKRSIVVRFQVDYSRSKAGTELVVYQAENMNKCLNNSR